MVEAEVMVAATAAAAAAVLRGTVAQLGEGEMDPYNVEDPSDVRVRWNSQVTAAAA